MEKLWMLHLTALCLIAAVAIVGLTAMVVNNGKAPEHAQNDKVKDNAQNTGKQLGSFCTEDSQCASGHCDGEILLKNGQTVPNLRVCT